MNTTATRKSRTAKTNTRTASSKATISDLSPMPLDNADQETIEEYSAESRTYHAYYDEVGTSEYTPFELLADNNHSSNVPIFWVTIRGAAIIACTSSLNLQSHFGLAFKHCNCFPPCSSLQVESSA
jgi:hypothetical protein